jgi:alpha-amylase
MYFQVHQPFRIRPTFDFFSIGSQESYEDEETNSMVMRRVAQKCYLPTNALLLELIYRYQGKFRISFSITGTALDQMESYEPQVLDSFKRLVETGCVEILAETYYHSLASLFSEAEFRRQVRKHQARIHDVFGVKQLTFRNTELIYNDRLGTVVDDLGFKAVLAEGADRILGWHSPNFVYRPLGVKGTALLLKNYRLSDDIAFRFSCRDWNEWPLTADKYASWLHQGAGSGDVVNLFMDYETFGEHQWHDSGILAFLKHLPEEILRDPNYCFKTPSEIAATVQPVSELSMPTAVSWADTERDTSAWLGNSMQDAAMRGVLLLESEVLASHDEGLADAWRRLQTSDHFYYMCTKWFQDGDVHKYFNPYQSPYDAFIHYTNALSQLKWRLGQCEKLPAQSPRRVREGGPKRMLAAEASRISALRVPAQTQIVAVN